MPQHTPAPDETVRMRPDSANGRPPLTGNPAIRRDEADETRPVTRDWLHGAPEAVPPPVPQAPAATATDEGTDRFDLSALDTPSRGPDATAIADDPAPSGEAPGDEPPADDDRSGAPRSPWWRRTAVLVPAGAVAVLAAAYGIDLAVSQGSIPRSTVVAGVDIGGLSPAAASATLEKSLAPRVKADRHVLAAGVDSVLSPAAAGIALDIPTTVDAAGHQPLNPLTRLVTLFSHRSVRPTVTTDRTALDAQLEAIAAKIDRAPVDATIAISGTTPKVVPPAEGRTLDRQAAATAITGAVRAARIPASPVTLPVKVAAVHVDAAEAQRVLESTVTPALAAPVTVSATHGGTTAEVPVTAIASSLKFTPEDDGKLAVSVDPAALQKSLGDRLTAFGSPATDATFTVSGGSVRVVPSKDGTGIAPAHLAEQLLPVLATPAPRKLSAELGPIPASFTTEQARALGIKEEVSSFTTHFTSAASGTNIRVVAAKVDGAVVKPGAVFSLNTFTGPRGTAQGYIPAAVISGGQLSKAVGGGISQFATTMFNAMYFAGLEDVHHKTHSFYISRYPAGREATVYEGLIDLQWKNDSSTGIFVDTTWSPGTLTVTFYGTKHYEISSIEGAHTNARQPAVQEKVDTDGSCIPQSGVPGFDVTVTRVFHDLGTGAEVRRENFHTHYAAEAIIHCLKPTTPKPAPPAPPAAPGD